MFKSLSPEVISGRRPDVISPPTNSEMENGELRRAFLYILSQENLLNIPKIVEELYLYSKTKNAVVLVQFGDAIFTIDAVAETQRLVVQRVCSQITARVSQIATEN